MEEQKDWLTGLYNLKFGLNKLEELINKSDKDNETFGFIYVDLDNQKRFNDLYGFPEGDKLICRIADKIKESVENNVFVIRSGGDEFFILLPEFSKKSTLKLVEELRFKIEKMIFEINEETVSSITATFGIAIYPFHGEDKNTLIKNAEEALNQGKLAGKNKVVILEKRFEIP